MAALVVGALTVLKVTGGPRNIVEAIDRERSFDNTMLATQIAVSKNSWAIAVSNYTQAELDALEAALAATPPITCSGDILGGSVSCHPEVHGSDPVAGMSPVLFNASFTLHAA